MTCRSLYSWIVLLMFVVSPALAADPVGPEPVKLWPDGAPGAQGTEAVDIPELRIYPAPEETRTGAMVIVLPGGGYGALATDHEGHQVAIYFNSIGVSAAVVKYRLGPRYQHPAPLQDAQRAIRYVRANATELNIDPQRVGIMGFSAGGHLASTVSTHFDAGEADSADAVAKMSSRPDFAILCYPVISLKSDFGHRGSLRNLLGDQPDPALIESLSNETQVTDNTPPTFIFHTGEDTGVPVMNAIVYYTALVAHKVPAELHIYQHGPHGVGLAPGNPVLSTWKDRLADWLKSNGFLKPTQRVSVKGVIEVHGKPLRWGAIAFQPIDHNSAGAWVLISHGKFNFSAQTGPVVGENDVRIWDLGDVVPFPTLDDAVDLKQGLRVDVSPQGPNEFNFNLE